MTRRQEPDDLDRVRGLVEGAQRCAVADELELAHVRRRLATVELPQRRLRWPLALAATAALAVALVPFALRRPPLTCSVGDDAAGADLRPGAPAIEGPVPWRFSDGTRLEFARGARGRLVAARADGATVRLDHGRLDAAVVHTGRATWQVEAGPFTILVTGTRFESSWSPAARTFSVALREGSVRVAGPMLGGGVPVVAGQLLQVWLSEGRFQMTPAKPTPPLPSPPERPLAAATGAAHDRPPPFAAGDRSSSRAAEPPPAAEAGHAPSGGAERPRRHQRRPPRVPEAPASAEGPLAAGPPPAVGRPPSLAAESLAARERRLPPGLGEPLSGPALPVPPPAARPALSPPAQPESWPLGLRGPPLARRAPSTRATPPAAHLEPVRPNAEAQPAGGADVAPAPRPLDACASADAERLLLHADRQRLAGFREGALAALATVRRCFPGDERAGDATFAIGVASMDEHPSAAAGWFRAYLQEFPRGQLASEAAGRLVEALALSGDKTQTRAAARQYLERHPAGPHAARARRLLGEEGNGR